MSENLKSKNNTYFAFTDREIEILLLCLNKLAYENSQIEQPNIQRLPAISDLDFESVFKSSVGIILGHKYILPYKLNEWHWNVLHIMVSEDKMIFCKRYDTDGNSYPIQDNVFGKLKDFFGVEYQFVNLPEQKEYNFGIQRGCNCGLAVALITHDILFNTIYAGLVESSDITDNCFDQNLRDKVSDIVEKYGSYNQTQLFCREIEESTLSEQEYSETTSIAYPNIIPEDSDHTLFTSNSAYTYQPNEGPSYQLTNYLYQEAPILDFSQTKFDLSSLSHEQKESITKELSFMLQNKFIYSHQADAVVYAILANLNGKGFILSDQPGVGKTRTIISIAHIYNKVFNSGEENNTLIIVNNKDQKNMYYKEIYENNFSYIYCFTKAEINNKDAFNFSMYIFDEYHQSFGKSERAKEDNILTKLTQAKILKDKNQLDKVITSGLVFASATATKDIKELKFLILYLYKGKELPTDLKKIFVANEHLDILPLVTEIVPYFLNNQGLSCTRMLLDSANFASLISNNKYTNFFTDYDLSDFHDQKKIVDQYNEIVLNIKFLKESVLSLDDEKDKPSEINTILLGYLNRLQESLMLSFRINDAREKIKNSPNRKFIFCINEYNKQHRIESIEKYFFSFNLLDSRPLENLRKLDESFPLICSSYLSNQSDVTFNPICINKDHRIVVFSRKELTGTNKNQLLLDENKKVFSEDGFHLELCYIGHATNEADFWQAIHRVIRCNNSRLVTYGVHYSISQLKFARYSTRNHSDQLEYLQSFRALQANSSLNQDDIIEEVLEDQDALLNIFGYVPRKERFLVESQFISTTNLRKLGSLIRSCSQKVSGKLNVYLDSLYRETILNDDGLGEIFIVNNTSDYYVYILSNLTAYTVFMHVFNPLFGSSAKRIQSDKDNSSYFLWKMSRQDYNNIIRIMNANVLVIIATKYNSFEKDSSSNFIELLYKMNKEQQKQKRSITYSGLNPSSNNKQCVNIKSTEKKRLYNSDNDMNGAKKSRFTHNYYDSSDAYTNLMSSFINNSQSFEDDLKNYLNEFGYQKLHYLDKTHLNLYHYFIMYNINYGTLRYIKICEEYCKTGDRSILGIKSGFNEEFYCEFRGWTLLHMAVHESDYDAVLYLCNNAPNIINCFTFDINDNSTALHMAFAALQEEPYNIYKKNIVEILVKYGASLYLKDSQGLIASELCDANTLKNIFHESHEVMISINEVHSRNSSSYTALNILAHVASEGHKETTLSDKFATVLFDSLSQELDYLEAEKKLKISTCQEIFRRGYYDYTDIDILIDTYQSLSCSDKMLQDEIIDTLVYFLSSQNINILNPYKSYKEFFKKLNDQHKKKLLASINDITNEIHYYACVTYFGELLTKKLLIGKYLDKYDLDIAFDVNSPVVTSEFGYEEKLSMLTISLRKSDIEMFKKLLLLGAKVYNRFHFGDFSTSETLIYEAILLGEIDAFKLLLEHSQNDNHLNILLFVLREENYLHRSEIFKFIEKKYTVDIFYENNFNEFYNFVSLFHKEFTIELKDSSGFSPLESAILYDFPDVVQFFIENYDISMESSLTIYNWAKEKEYGYIVNNFDTKIFADLQDFSFEGEFDESLPITPLIFDELRVESSLYTESGVTGLNDTVLHVKDQNDNTPLHWAVENGKTEIALALIEKGANLDIQDKYGRTPLHWAIGKNTPEIALALLNKGADLDIQDNEQGYTPLSLAISKNNPEIALALINKSANLDIKDKYGQAPLHWAIGKNIPEIALALINKGANLDIKNKYGQAPLHWAIGKNIPEIALALINKGANLDIKDKDGRTPLHWAIGKNTPEIALALLNKGANLDMKDKDGYTPLHLTCIKDNIEITHFLIDKGANLDIKNKYGKVPLHLAIEYSMIDLAITLINKGADINYKDKDGKTALVYAFSCRKYHIVEALVARGADFDSEEEFVGFVFGGSNNIIYLDCDNNESDILYYKVALEFAKAKGYSGTASQLSKALNNVLSESLGGNVVNRYNDELSAVSESRSDANNSLLVGCNIN
jgi:ankyrin repeat protein